ncbi:MAG: hypothetical protein ACK58T_38090, partial [Phycisphaerae bacterium]
MIYSLAALSVLFSAGISFLGPGDYSRTIQMDGYERSYLVHIPPNYDPKKPTPVILAFHGGGANANHMVAYCG